MAKTGRSLNKDGTTLQTLQTPDSYRCYIKESLYDESVKRLYILGHRVEFLGGIAIGVPRFLAKMMLRRRLCFLIKPEKVTPVEDYRQALFEYKTTPKMNMEEALSVVADITSIAEKLRKRIWIQDGLLLGLIRDGRLIPWDTDVDMGCKHSDWDREFHYALRNHGFLIRNRKNVGPRVVKNGIEVDIFLHKIDNKNGKLYWSVYDWMNVGKTKHTEYRFFIKPFNTEKRNFYGKNFYIPSPPESWLEQKYGPNWRVPISGWNYASDPANSKAKFI